VKVLPDNEIEQNHQKSKKQKPNVAINRESDRQGRGSRQWRKLADTDGHRPIPIDSCECRRSAGECDPLWPISMDLRRFRSKTTKTMKTYLPKYMVTLSDLRENLI